MGDRYRDRIATSDGVMLTPILLLAGLVTFLILSSRTGWLEKLAVRHAIATRAADEIEHISS